jgi:hypothetical protein
MYYHKEKTMKTKLTVMASAILMGSAFSVSAATPPVANPAAPGALSIIAAERASIPPTFNRAEQTGLCLMETVVSLLAARTNDFGCARKEYDLAVYTTDNEGIGQADIGDGVNFGGTSITASLSPTISIGTRCNVATARGVNLLNGVGVDLVGDHGWSRTNEIFNSHALMRLRDPQTGSYNFYKEVNIKDYFKRVIAGRSWEFDWGLEDIKKFRGFDGKGGGFAYPVQKWQELSWYQHENGGEGQLHVHKYQMIPRSASACRIDVNIPEGNMFNGSGEFEATGTVTVGPRLF